MPYSDDVLGLLKLKRDMLSYCKGSLDYNVLEKLDKLFPSFNYLAYNQMKTEQEKEEKLVGKTQTPSAARGMSYTSVTKPRYGRNVDVASLPIPGNQGISLEYWEVRNLLAMGRAMGRPIHVDETTTKRELGYFASVFVDIDMSKSIPDKLWIKSKKHGIGSCRSLKKDLAKNKDTKVVVVVPDKDVMVGTVTGSTAAEKPISKSQKKKWRKKYNKSNKGTSGAKDSQGLNEKASNPVIAVSEEGCISTAAEVVTTQSSPTVANNSGMIECSIDRNASIVNHHSSPDASVLQSEHVLGLNGNGEESATPEELLSVVVSDSFET
ncbi:hypothetical protein IFM89_031044 [Coptis chinensis]|uniref:Uncharacterized protein n=1 Tax=Coptis chinensis TaxID=261450 RepID=A0A835LJ74_9MAGN|nr:hypothetical protein IFM89_031044 [Coptis chinensis]